MVKIFIFQRSSYDETAHAQARKQVPFIRNLRPFQSINAQNVLNRNPQPSHVI